MISAGFAFFCSGWFASKAARAASSAWWSEATAWALVAALALIFAIAKVSL